MATILITFFGIVIAVNVMMARFAISTFGGVVVENSYVASQKFNGWLEQARADKALGWHAVVDRAPWGDVRAQVTDSRGAPVAGARVTAVAEHPLGLRHNEQITFRETEPGLYAAKLESGRWQVKLTVEAQGHTWREIGDVE
jgi:nitrogen fixation protein FixH